MSATVQPPREDCPKCGDPGGFLWADEGENGDRPARPRYVDYGDRTFGAIVVGGLVWRCRTCRYDLDGPTADAS